MKVAVFTGRWPTVNRLLEVEQAAAIASQHKTQLLVLPGHSFRNERNHHGTSQAQQLAKTHQIAILAELSLEMNLSASKVADKNKSLKKGAGFNMPWETYLFKPDGTSEGPWRQHFVNSTQANRRTVAQRLVNDFANGHRLFVIGGKKVGFLYCGEMNILKNDKTTFQASLRHPDLGWTDAYDLLLNPTHDSMSNLHHLIPKFQWFSSAGRSYVYTTNNTRQTSWKSACYVYQNGRQLMNGQDPRMIDHGSWRLALFDIP